MDFYDYIQHLKHKKYMISHLNSKVMQNMTKNARGDEKIPRVQAGSYYDHRKKEEF
jgi:hypothetical protein